MFLERQATRSEVPRPVPGRSTAFTLLELLAVFAIIAMLAAALMPVFSRAKLETRRVGCVNHLKQLALGQQLYSADNDGKLPENFPGSLNETGRSPWSCGNMKDSKQSSDE